MTKLEILLERAILSLRELEPESTTLDQSMEIKDLVTKLRQRLNEGKTK